MVDVGLRSLLNNSTTSFNTAQSPSLLLSAMCLGLDTLTKFLNLGSRKVPFLSPERLPPKYLRASQPSRGNAVGKTPRYQERRANSRHHRARRKTSNCQAPACREEPTQDPPAVQHCRRSGARDVPAPARGVHPRTVFRCVRLSGCEPSMHPADRRPKTLL